MTSPCAWSYIVKVISTVPGDLRIFTRPTFNVSGVRSGCMTLVTR